MCVDSWLNGVGICFWLEKIDIWSSQKLIKTETKGKREIWKKILLKNNNNNKIAKSSNCKSNVICGQSFDNGKNGDRILTTKKKILELGAFHSVSYESNFALNFLNVEFFSLFLVRFGRGNGLVRTKWQSKMLIFSTMRDRFSFLLIKFRTRFKKWKLLSLFGRMEWQNGRK